MIPLLLVLSYRLNTTRKGIFLKCENCYGHAVNPALNPLCRFGCNRFITATLSTKKFITNSNSAQPVTTKAKLTARNIISKPYPRILLLTIPGAAILLIIVFVIVKCQLLKKTRQSRVSSVEPQIANQYICWNMSKLIHVPLTCFDISKFGSVTILVWRNTHKNKKERHCNKINCIQ